MTSHDDCFRTDRVDAAKHLLRQRVAIQHYMLLGAFRPRPAINSSCISPVLRSTFKLAALMSEPSFALRCFALSLLRSKFTASRAYYVVGVT